MKWKIRAAGFFLTFSVVAGVLVNYNISASQPGTSADPLVSKSYVDGKISEILSQIGGGTAASIRTAMDTESIVSDVVAQIEFLYGDKLREPSDAGSNDYVPQADKYVPVSASYGQIIVGDEGCEIILRSGAAIVYSNVSNGLVDVTGGAELNHGAEVQANHMLIVPRGDGRGVAVTGSEAWFMIKGQYELHN